MGLQVEKNKAKLFNVVENRIDFFSLFSASSCAVLIHATLVSFLMEDPGS